MRRRMMVCPLALFAILWHTLPVTADDLSVSPPSLAASQPARLSGAWTFTFGKEHSNRNLPAPLDPSDCTFKQEGTRLTGSCGSDAIPLMGVVNGHRVTFRLESGESDRRAAEATLTAVLNPEATTMKGTWYARNAEGAFSATKHND